MVDAAFCRESSRREGIFRNEPRRPPSCEDDVPIGDAGNFRVAVLPRSAADFRGTAIAGNRTAATERRGATFGAGLDGFRARILCVQVFQQ